MNAITNERTPVAHRLAFAIICALGLMCSMLIGCSPSQQSPTTSNESTADASPGQTQSAQYSNSTPGLLEGLVVSKGQDFGGINFSISIDDFNACGFAFGDSVDIVFSNGYELTGIPYYNGYYANIGDPLLVGYPGYSTIRAALSFGDSLWEASGLSEGDTATIRLNTADAFHTVQIAHDVAYTNDRTDYASNETFANFRACAGGTLAPNVLYRSASPIDNECNRAPYASALLKQAGVQFVLDLSDNDDKVDEYAAFDEEHGIDVTPFLELRNTGNVALLNLTANYSSDEFKQSLAQGLIEMTQHDGPYLVHCVEGKDRTGFVCLLLEALCGASYDELAADYMASYANYYGITKDSETDRYDAIRDLNFDGMLRYLANVDDQANLQSIDYAEPARYYLRSSGMTDAQIDALIARIAG
ncbi:MAG: tyrosine-protein phosphatase [Eggerthellaceae bacterium]|nr:tyrosine-protein phosphatase [Eggerthellaceae bacterium]